MSEALNREVHDVDKRSLLLLSLWLITSLWLKIIVSSVVVTELLSLPR